MRLEAIAVVFALILLAGCVQPPAQKPDSYYEIVKEKNSATGGHSSIEYMITSNGNLLKKESSGERTIVTSWNAKNESALNELNYVKGSIVPKTEDTDCTECVVYHLFYFDENGVKRTSLRKENAGEFLKGMVGRTESIALQSQKQETFFIQIVYSKEKTYIDYHIFKDGTVVYEEFGQENGELLSSRMMKIEPKSLEGIIEEGIYAQNGNAMECGSKPYSYGYVQVAIRDKYAFVYTCGAGENSADRLFNKLIATVEK